MAPHLSSTLGGLLLRCLLRGVHVSASGIVYLQGDYPWHADSLCLIYDGDPDLETAHPEFVAENNIKGTLDLGSVEDIAFFAGQQRPDVTVEELVTAFNHYYVHDGFLWYEDETFA
jgi:hypothetical protein